MADPLDEKPETLTKLNEYESVKVVENIDLILDDEEYKEYKYRYFIIFIFALPNLINAILWITCSPISKTLKEIVLP